MSPISSADFAPRDNRAAVMEHLLHRDGQGVFVAQHHHAQRIADQDGINAGLVHAPARWDSRRRSAW